MGRLRWQKELWIECWLSLGDDSYNALLSNVYASSGNWSHYIEVKNAMEMKLKKDYVLSSADIIKDIHSSKVEDWSHQRLNRYATGKKKKIKTMFLIQDLYCGTWMRRRRVLLYYDSLCPMEDQWEDFVL